MKGLTSVMTSEQSDFGLNLNFTPGATNFGKREPRNESTCARFEIEVMVNVTRIYIKSHVCFRALRLTGC